MILARSQKGNGHGVRGQIAVSKQKVLWLRCLSRRHGYLIPLSWRMVPGSLFDTRRSLSSGPGPDASKQLAARDGYLSAVSQLKSVPAHAGRRCIPLSLGMSPPLMIVVLFNF